MSLSYPLDQRSKLQESRTLIIGGSSGVGFGVAEALAKTGASVIISSSSAERLNHALQRLQATCKQSGPPVIGYVCNMSSRNTVEKEVESLFTKVTQEGKLDHVLYTAGDKLAVGELSTFTLDEIIQAGMVRFFGPLIVAKFVQQHLNPGLASSYTLTTGGAADRPPKGWPAITPYLGGIEAMARSFAIELAPIRVNLVRLGLIDTELWDDMKKAGQFDEFKTSAESKMVTKQVGKVQDVVECYLYFMRDRNATGSTLRSDGGALLM